MTYEELMKDIITKLRLAILNIRYNKFNALLRGEIKLSDCISTISSDMQGLNNYNRLRAQESINQFTFSNLMIKQLYKIVGNKKISKETKKLIECQKHLSEYLKNPKDEHNRPDTCLTDWTNYQTFLLEQTLENKGLKLKKPPRGERRKLEKEEFKKQEKEEKLKRKNEREKNDIIFKLKQEEEKKKEQERLLEEKRLKEEEKKLLNSIKLTKNKEENNTEINLNSIPETVENKEEKYKPIDIKEKIKTRKESMFTQVEEKEEEIEKPLFKPFYLKGSKWEDFQEFWKKKAGVTYKEFQSVFNSLGGKIDEGTGSSHVVLQYTDTNGITHTGGTWIPHGFCDAYGYNSLKDIKDYFTLWGLTPEWVQEQEEKNE